MNLVKIGAAVKTASQSLALVERQQKDAFLTDLAGRLTAAQVLILEANAVDVALAEAQGLSEAVIDRLRITPERIAAMAADVLTVAALDDPAGSCFDEKIMPNGLRIHKMRVPLGVLAVIYEARPNVTIDVACLALKSGNAVILRGGKETIHSNRALVAVVHQALMAQGISTDAVQFIDSPDRDLVLEMLGMSDVIDMLIPRGGAALHRFCRENSKIPVITGGVGICHLFVDASANQEASIRIIHNAKTQRPSVCNALDTVLVHASIAPSFLPRMVKSLVEDGVSFRVDAPGLSLLKDVGGDILPAGQDDFDTEWLSLVLGIKVVNDINEAITHIQLHSTGHSDGILTENSDNARRFVQAVDSAAVYVNASTRFTDGSQLGLGAEVAISTQRLHARGPMALEALTTYKWVIQGEYQVRS